MTNFDEQGRPEPPIGANEVETLIGFLDYQRATLAWKTSGLGARDLNRTTASSSMTLGGLLKHLTWVEDYWFSRRLLGRPPAPQWADIDWRSEPDWEWTSAATDSPAELKAMWSATVEASRSAVDGALRSGSLDQFAATPWPNGESPSLRWILVHMIEEYARHNGHADLLRESIDGLVGE